MHVLEINNLCKYYEDFMLENISLTLPSGCIMGLIGENGAGKTTIIKLILNMLQKNSGTIKVLGKDNQENFELTKEDIGVVLSEVGFPSYLNAMQIGKIMAKTFSNWDNNCYYSFLKMLSIPQNKKFKEFSQGMKMKLGFAVALSHHAKLLILDEATNGLDPVVRDEITDLLLEFTRDESHSILISSHIVTDLEKICDYVAFIQEGKLMLCEEKDRLKEEYAFMTCSKEEFAALDQSAVIGKRENKYGTDVIIRRDCVSLEANISSVTLEELFVFMVKGVK